MHRIHVLNFIMNLMGCQVGFFTNFAKMQSQEQIYLMVYVQEAQNLLTRD